MKIIARPHAFPGSSRHVRRALVPLALLACAAGGSFAMPGCASAERTGASGAALQAADVSTGLVISQVYGGGGNVKATYTNDFIELFNAGTTPVNVSGMSVQYSSATGTAWTAHTLSTTSPDIPPGGYYLVQLNSAAAVGVALPAPDDTSTIDMAESNGKVALVQGTDALVCGDTDPNACAALAIDFVGYGSANEYAGGGPAAGLSSTTSAQRLGGGCTDVDDNKMDFNSGVPLARNSATPVNPCSGGGSDAGVDSGLDASVDGGGGGGGSDSGSGDAGGGATGSSTFVISQVFGAGGSNGAPYDVDYVEIFNRSGGPLSLDGLSLQYGSATGDFASMLSDGGVPNLVPLTYGQMVPAGGYVLVGMGTGTSDAGAPLPTADIIGTASLSGTAGKVAIARTTSSLDCGNAATPCATTEIVDLVGYGNVDGGAANEFEGAGPVPSLSATTAALRNGGGCVDTDDNASDFTVGPPAPRNSATMVNVCAGAAPADGGTSSGGSDAGGTGTGTGTATVDSGLELGEGNGSNVKTTIVPIDDPNSGGCSTRGGTGAGDAEGAASFGLFTAVVAVIRRRRRGSTSRLA